MAEKFNLVFDELMIKQLRKASRDGNIKTILSKMFDRIELLGPLAGELLDSKIFIYEMKNKHPPIRLYYKHNRLTDEMYIFEFEMKTSEQKQQQTINRLRTKVSET
jgi:hypothetical protein